MWRWWLLQQMLNKIKKGKLSTEEDGKLSKDFQGKKHSFSIQARRLQSIRIGRMRQRSVFLHKHWSCYKICRYIFVTLSLYDIQCWRLIFQTHFCWHRTRMTSNLYACGRFRFAFQQHLQFKEDLKYLVGRIPRSSYTLQTGIHIRDIIWLWENVFSIVNIADR